MYDEALEFQYSSKKYDYNCDFNELKNNRGNIQYTRLCRKLVDMELDTSNDFKYENVILDDIRNIVYELYSGLVKKDKLNEIKRFNSLLLTHDFSMIEKFSEFESAICLDVPTGAVNFILTSDKLYSIQVLAVAHEYMHGLLAKYEAEKMNQLFCNIHYREMLSVFMEYLLKDKVAEMFPNDNIKEAHTTIRVNHDKDSAAMYNKIYSLPITTMEKDYIRHVTYGYLVSSVYALALKEKYLEDSKLFVNLLDSLLNNDLSIGDLLKYYGINFGKTETIKPYMDNIMTLEKKCK